MEVPEYSFLRLLLVGQYPGGNLGGLSLNGLVAIGAFWLSLPFALMLGVARSSTLRVPRAVAGVYVELVRATPLLMIVFWMYFCLPMLFGWEMSNIASALLAITVYASAYQAEIIRGGLLAVEQGEIDAAHALGMSPWQSLWFVKVPQACRTMAPCFLSFFVSLLKDTSVLFVVGLVDVLQAGVIYSERHPGRMLTAYVSVAALFFLLCFALSRAVSRWEKRMMAGDCEACAESGLVSSAARTGPRARFLPRQVSM